MRHRIFQAEEKAAEVAKTVVVCYDEDKRLEFEVT